MEKEEKENESSEFEDEEDEEGEEFEEISDNNSQDKQGRISVFVRIRPFIQNEIELDNTSPIKSVNTKNNSLICKKKNITFYS
jgi:hypothetical protein